MDDVVPRRVEDGIGVPVALVDAGVLELGAIPLGRRSTRCLRGDFGRLSRRVGDLLPQRSPTATDRVTRDLS